MPQAAWNGEEVTLTDSGLARCSQEPRVLKLLFPHNSCGVVMGRGGEFIRQLITATGASVRISQPSEMIVATQELN